MRTIQVNMSSAAGFSMLELLIATTIGAAILGPIIMVTGQLQTSYARQLDGGAVQQEARYALDWITRTLASAGSNPSNITVSACPAAGTTFRAIRRDPNGDSVQNDIRIHADVSPPNGVLGGLTTAACTEAGEDITIAYDAANRTITRRDNNIDGAAVAMSDRVMSQLAFAYLDSNRAVAAADSAVSFIQVTVSAQNPTADLALGQPLTFTLTSEVRVRTR